MIYDITGGNSVTGEIQIIPPEAVLTSDVKEGNIPLTVIFDASESVGQSMNLSFTGNDNIVPVEMAEPTSGWNNIPITFTRIGKYTATLTVFGGTEHRIAELMIDVWPPVPEDSEKLIIRALKITADYVEFKDKINRDMKEGDQV